MNNERLMVRIVLPVILVAWGFTMTMERSRGQPTAGHCDIEGTYTCTANCQNKDVGAAWVKRLESKNTYLFHNEANAETEGYEDPESPSTYQIPGWVGHAKPDKACRGLFFSNGTHWIRS